MCGSRKPPLDAAGAEIACFAKMKDGWGGGYAIIDEMLAEMKAGQLNPFEEAVFKRNVAQGKRNAVGSLLQANLLYSTKKPPKKDGFHLRNRPSLHETQLKAGFVRHHIHTPLRLPNQLYVN